MSAANKIEHERSITDHNTAWNIEREAANDADPTRTEPTATRPETLDGLAKRLGNPNPTAARVAFRGYDASAGLDQGKDVATERILRAVPVFVGSVTALWAALTDAQRKKVLGYTEAFLPVLVSETVKLQALNARYDRVARLASVSRSHCEAVAGEQLREARDLRDQVLRVLSEFVPPSPQSVALKVAARGAETADKLGVALEALGDWIREWLAASPADERALYATMGFDAALADELGQQADRVREAQADLDAIAGDTRVTQRELDAQDGRVLHVVGVIHQAFRSAVRRDPTIVAPDLADLDTVFERAPRGPRTTDEDTPATPPAPAAPTPA
jgi:hypothetical protein